MNFFILHYRIHAYELVFPALLARGIQVEDDFKIKLPDERIELKTLQDVVNVLDKATANQKT